MSKNLRFFECRVLGGLCRRRRVFATQALDKFLVQGGSGSLNSLQFDLGSETVQRIDIFHGLYCAPLRGRKSHDYTEVNDGESYLVNLYTRERRRRIY